MIRFISAFVMACFAISCVTAQDNAAIANIAKQLIVKKLPDPAIQSSKNWDKQSEVTVRVQAERQGPLKWKFEAIKEKRNDGHWTKIAMTVVEPNDKLALEIKDVSSPEEGQTKFTTVVAAPVKFQFEQQMWKMGVRLYSGETRGRCDAKIILNCIANSRTDWSPGKLLPQQIFQVTVKEAELSYEHLKIEHTAGVGGEAAEKLGVAVIAAIKLIKPNLEKDLVEKANAAIVKAGQSKEVKLDFDKLLGK